MKSIWHLHMFFCFSFICIFPTSYSQNTCDTSCDYGNNSNAGKYTTVNGIRMYFETYGDRSKQALLLIHGNGGSIYYEKCQIEHFKNKYYVIAADSRFHGKTEDGTETLTYDLMAKDYNALLDFLKIDSAYIIGQSDGGIIGLLLAINYSKKVKKLVSTAPNLRPDTTALPQWDIDYVKNDLVEIENRIKKGERSENLYREMSYLNLMDKYPNIMNIELTKIHAPVLVMAGDGDIIRLEHILKIFQNIPNAQLFIMPGATHFMLREEYGLFNQIVDRFLDNPFKRPTTKEQLLK
jgi:pimeloyl-ACP methyl ester carboxylesterase